MPQLILINGAPGTGKTTLARWLTARTGLPALGKDDIKEFLFDAMGYSDRDWSRVLGRSSVEMLYVFARECLMSGQTVIIENAFFREFAQPVLAGLVDELHVEVIEIYCQVDEETRMERFRNRAEVGERHPGHVDNLATWRDTSDYQPIGVGQTIVVDTAASSDQVYDAVFSQLETLLR